MTTKLNVKRFEIKRFEDDSIGQGWSLYYRGRLRQRGGIEHIGRAVGRVVVGWSCLSRHTALIRAQRVTKDELAKEFFYNQY